MNYLRIQRALLGNKANATIAFKIVNMLLTPLSNNNATDIPKDGNQIYYTIGSALTIAATCLVALTCIYINCRCPRKTRRVEPATIKPPPLATSLGIVPSIPTEYEQDLVVIRKL